uniref:Uncharacterized protein n=1 Tax=Arundo donax TaxID=35708 RepID=A0A0A9BGE9_ARUDO
MSLAATSSCEAYLPNFSTSTIFSNTCAFSAMYTRKAS